MSFLWDTHLPQLYGGNSAFYEMMSDKFESNTEETVERGIQDTIKWLETERSHDLFANGKNFDI